MKTRIMYIEDKSQGLSGPARIGRVEMTKLGKTIYYRGRTFRTLGAGALRRTFMTSRPASTSGFPDRDETVLIVSTGSECPSR